MMCYDSWERLISSPKFANTKIVLYLKSKNASMDLESYSDCNFDVIIFGRASQKTWSYRHCWIFGGTIFSNMDKLFDQYKDEIEEFLSKPNSF